MPPIVLKTPSMGKKGAVATITMPQPQKKQQPKQKVKVVVQTQKKKKKNKKKKGGYLNAILNPFSNVPCHIPDEHTSPSALAVSNVNLRFSTSRFDSSTSTTSSFGFVMTPYPGCGYVTIAQLALGGAFTDIGPAGTASSYNSVTNASSLYGGTPYSAKVRCVSMGIRVAYEGTELNRAGSIYAGLGPNNDVPVSITGGTQLSFVSAFTGRAFATLGQIRDSLTQVSESRISDGVFEAHWKPAGVPSYQVYGSGTYGTSTSTGITPVAASLLQAPQGAPGCEAGQNFLVVMIENDTQSVASITSNIYAIEMTWCWEIIPDNPNAVAYMLSASRMDMSSLQNAINNIQSAPVARYLRAGQNRPRF